jgi:hypothetical protein
MFIWYNICADRCAVHLPPGPCGGRRLFSHTEVPAGGRASPEQPRFEPP